MFGWKNQMVVDGVRERRRRLMGLDDTGTGF